MTDFFEARWTTGQVAVYNKEDKGNRKFILVQFQKDTKKVSFKAIQKKIVDITIERNKRVQNRKELAEKRRKEGGH
jgi:hypothetical protein